MKRNAVEAVVEACISMNEMTPYEASLLREKFADYLKNPGQFRSAEDVLTRIDRLYDKTIFMEIVSAREFTKHSVICVTLSNDECTQHLRSDLRDAMHSCQNLIRYVLRWHGIEDNCFPMGSAGQSKPLIRENKKLRKLFGKLMSKVPDSVEPPELES